MSSQFFTGSYNSINCESESDTLNWTTEEQIHSDIFDTEVSLSVFRTLSGLDIENIGNWKTTARIKISVFEFDSTKIKEEHWKKINQHFMNKKMLMIVLTTKNDLF